MHRTNIHEIFPDWYTHRLRDVAMATAFSGLIGEKWRTPPSFIAPAFHNGLEYRNADERINTSDDPSTSDSNLVSFSPVIPKITRLDHIQQVSINTRVCFTTVRWEAALLDHAGYTLGFAAYF